MHHESEWLDQYFDALLRDPQAQPPANLDAETVALIKALVDTRHQPPEDEQIKDRVWSRVLFATYAPPEMEPSYSEATRQPLVVSPAAGSRRAAPVRKSQRVDLAFMVAAMFALVCLTGLFIQHTDAVTDNLSRYHVEATRTIKYPPSKIRIMEGIDEWGIRDQVSQPIIEVSSVNRQQFYPMRMPE